MRAADDIIDTSTMLFDFYAGALTNDNGVVHNNTEYHNEAEQGDNIDAKTDDGWKETLAKISEAHPSSELNKQYGKTSITDIKVNQVREKHKTLAKRRMAKQNPIK